MELIQSPDDPSVGYLRLPSHPGSAPGVVKRSTQLVDLLGRYSGPELVLDFDENDVLIGVEILGD